MKIQLFGSGRAQMSTGTGEITGLILERAIQVLGTRALGADPS